MTAAAATPTAQPSLRRRLLTVARFPFGMVIITLRYLWHYRAFVRVNVAGDASDLPADLPPRWVDDRVKPLPKGHGPLFRRSFTVRMTGSDVDAAGLMDRLVQDLDRAAPSEVVTFRKIRGELGTLEEGDEYRVRIPAPWDGPVRVVHRDATSFRFTTLRGHLEAGQIEFRAVDEGPGAVRFEIETWSRAGTPLARLAFVELGVGREVQLNMWAQFCLAMPRLARARRSGRIRITTRRWDGVGS